MRNADFDAFVELLQSSVGRAQKLVEKRNQGRLERQLQLDAEGRPEMLAWSFAIEDTESDTEAQRTVRLPLAVLRPHLMPKLNEVVLEFDAAIVETEPAQQPSAVAEADRVVDAVTAGQSPEPAAPIGGGLALLLRRGWWPLRRKLHKIKIRLRGKQPGTAEVYVDDTLLKVVTAADEPPDDNGNDDNDKDNDNDDNGNDDNGNGSNQS